MTLFEDTQEYRMDKEALGAGAVVLRRFALPGETALLTALNEVIVQAPSRQMRVCQVFWLIRISCAQQKRFSLAHIMHTKR